MCVCVCVCVANCVWKARSQKTGSTWCFSRSHHRSHGWSDLVMRGESTVVQYLKYDLVGGFNPFEKYWSKKPNLPPIQVKIENIWNHHPVIFMIWQNTICLDPLLFFSDSEACFFFNFHHDFCPHRHNSPKKHLGKTGAAPTIGCNRGLPGRPEGLTLRPLRNFGEGSWSG